MTTTPQYLKEHNETPQKPPGPKAGMWSLRYLDPMTGVRLRFNKTIRQLYSDFPEVLPPGTEFPGFDLETTDGNRINTADLRGKKHLVLMTGAIT